MLTYFFTGLLLSVLITLMSVLLFPKIGLLDFPERYNLKRQKIPYPGGLGLLVLSLGIVFIDARFLGLLFPIVVLGLVCFWDDRKGLSSGLRFLIFFLLAVFIYYLGFQIDIIGHPFKDTNIDLTQLPVFISLMATVFWLMILQNATNWFDGVPGLSVGVMGVGFLTLGVLGVVRPELLFDPAHQGLTFANFYLAGLCMGALYFYWQKKIILGDTGSQVLGLLLGVMAIASGAKIATTLLVLLLPILDFFWVIFRRVFLDKTNPMKGDLGHLHHRLLQFFEKSPQPPLTRGSMTNEQKVTFILLTLTALLGIIAVFLTNWIKLSALILVGLIVLGVEVWLFRKKA